MLPKVRLQKPLKRNDLPQYRHGKFLDLQEKMAFDVFDAVVRRLLREVGRELRRASLEKSHTLEFERLAKAEEPRLKRRWTGDVPRVSIDVMKTLERLLDTYKLTLKYLFLGALAGNDAKRAAQNTFGDGITPGIVFGAYLHAIDAERALYHKLYGVEAPRIPMTLIRASFDIIHRQTSRQVEQSLNDLGNRLLDVVDLAVAQNRIENLFSVGHEAHELKDTHSKTKALTSAVEAEADELDHSPVVRDLTKVAAKAKEGFERMTKTSLSMASSVGTHQAVVEIYGAHSSDMRAALVNMRDSRCCDHCEELARNDDGSLRIYDLGSFRPAGFNAYRKRADWKLCVPPIHPNCRCFLVNIPKSFTINDNGVLILKPGVGP